MPLIVAKMLVSVGTERDASRNVWHMGNLTTSYTSELGSTYVGKLLKMYSMIVYDDFNDECFKAAAVGRTPRLT